MSSDLPTDIARLRACLPDVSETVETTDLEKFKGLSFEAFWKVLPKDLELFDYEIDLLEILENKKHLWIKKATGLGITELLIRWIAWKCVTNNEMRDKQVDTNVILITGPRIELAITIMTRLKNLFGRDFKSKETVCILNGNRIEAFPSHHLATARGMNPQIVFLDEADFFPPGQQQEARMVSERYIAKTDPHIIMVSTPNIPGGLFENMEKEKKSIYTMKKLNYEKGLDRIYKSVDIAKAKESPSFEREYNLKYGYGVGDIFPFIDMAIKDYDLGMKYGDKGLFIDPGYGTSKFGIVGFEKLDGILYVKEAKEFDRPSGVEITETVVTYSHQFDNYCKVDAAHPEFVKDLLLRGIAASAVSFGKKVVDPSKKEGAKISQRKLMTLTAASAVKEKKVIIHPMFTDLIAQLRSVKYDEKGGPDKKELTFDIGDAFLMGCYDMREHDYSYIQVSQAGKIVRDEKPIKKSGGLMINTEKFE